MTPRQILITIVLILVVAFIALLIGLNIYNKESYKLRGPDEVLDIHYKIPKSKAVNVNCVAGYTDWTDCSEECGGGETSRTYEVVAPSSGVGRECLHPDGYTETESCNEHVCPVDCVSSWSVPTECSEPCGGGETSTTHQVQTKSAGTGQECDHPDGYVATSDCNTHPCPIDCVGDWSEYGDCTKPCGSGDQTSTYNVSQPAMYGGIECDTADATVAIRDCNTQPCPIDCEGDVDWGDCSKSCGPGTKNLIYTTEVPAQYGGKGCTYNGKPVYDGKFVETEGCNDKPCPIDCEGEIDGDWGDCSEQCGGGEKTKKYRVTTEAKHGGNECLYDHGQDVEIGYCNTQPCPIDCRGAIDDDWGICSKECGGW